jgi:outer membrane protein OmpA-like peptidoglycan-associated protein
MARTTALLLLALTLAACGGTHRAVGPSGEMSPAEVAHVQSGGAVEVGPGSAPPATVVEPAGTPWPGEPSVTVLAWAESIVPTTARPAPVVLTDGQGRSATVEVALTPPPAPRTEPESRPESRPKPQPEPKPESQSEPAPSEPAPKSEPAAPPPAAQAPKPVTPKPATQVRPAPPPAPRVQTRSTIREEPLPPPAARAPVAPKPRSPAPRAPEESPRPARPEAESPAPAAPRPEAPDAPVVRRIPFAGQDGGLVLGPDATKVVAEVAQMYAGGRIGRLTVAGYGPARPAQAPVPEGQDAPPDLRLPMERAFAVARALEDAGVPLAAVTVSAHTGAPGSAPHVLLTAIPAPTGR